MDKAAAGIMIVAGGACLWAAFHVWHAKKGGNAAGQAGWHELIIILLVLAGLGLGGGLSLFLGLNFLYVKVLGIAPLWLPLALFFGIWWIADVVLRRAWTRTSVMGFFMALLIAVPVAPPALAAATHGHAPTHVISVTHKG